MQAINDGAVLLVSPIVLLELEVGILRSSNADTARAALEMTISLTSGIPPFEREDGQIAGKIRADLMRQGSLIGALDLLIAAQAIRMDAAIVTNNVREYARVPGLRWEDWTQA